MDMTHCCINSHTLHDLLNTKQGMCDRHVYDWRRFVQSAADCFASCLALSVHQMAN